MKIAVSSFVDLEDKIWLIQKDLETNGYCLIEAWESSQDVLREVCSKFGSVQRHIRSGKDGFVDVKAAAPTPKSIDSAVYFGTKAARFDPHTDGSYLHGLRLENGEAVKVGPPRLIALQCIESAEEGGANFLIDMQYLLRDMISKDPLHASLLMKEGALSFARDEQVAMDLPMFQKLKKGNYAVRFRSDEMVYAQHWVYPSIRHLQRKYLNNPKYLQKIKLERNQILLVDNTRMLHGRDEVPSTPENLKRHLRRAWIAEENRSILVNIAEAGHAHKAFTTYESYAPIEQGSGNFAAMKLNLGIKLSPESQMAIEHLQLGELA